MTFIYAFRDTGYQRGVKVGRDSSKSGLQRFERSFCYTPRSMEYVARWHIADGGSLAEAETMARLGLPPLRLANNGHEWINLEPKNLVQAVSTNLGRSPEAEGIRLKSIPSWEDFRNPKMIKPSDKYRQVLWTYEELETGALKTQRMDDWAAPRETRKTYSRNGFKPIFAFSYDGPVSFQGNRAVQLAWEAAMSEFGPGAGDEFHGWLHAGASTEQLRQFYAARGLKQLRDLIEKPEGVRRAYNKVD